MNTNIPAPSPGCGALGPKGYRCTHHENNEHVARGTENGSFAESWPIEPEATHNTEQDLEVAETILQQLGGKRFKMMTGARDLLAIKSGLTFRLPRGFAQNGISKVTITLTPADTYAIDFSRVHNLTITTVSQHADIYAEDLQRLFTDETGLNTRL